MELVQPHVCPGRGGRAHQGFRASHNCRFGHDSWEAGAQLTVDTGGWRIGQGGLDKECGELGAAPGYLGASGVLSKAPGGF